MDSGSWRSVVRAEEGQHQGRMHEACKADREKFCKDVKGGDHEAIAKVHA